MAACHSAASQWRLSGHSVCSPALYSFTLPLSPWACQPLPGTQYARPHFTASLFHLALGLASRFRALSMLARTLPLHSSTQLLGLPAASGHSACSPALYRFILPPSPWACQPLPGTQFARPHFTASLFHPALGLASRFRALSMLARTLPLHSSTQLLGLPAASGHSACSPALYRFTLPLSPWAYQPQRSFDVAHSPGQACRPALCSIRCSAHTQADYPSDRGHESVGQEEFRANRWQAPLGSQL